MRGTKAKAQRKAERAAGIPIEEIDVLRYQAAKGKVAEIEQEETAKVQASLALANQRIAGASKARDNLLTKLGQQYGFDPSKPFRIDETRRVIIPESIS